MLASCFVLAGCGHTNGPRPSRSATSSGSTTGPAPQRLTGTFTYFDSIEPTGQPPVTISAWKVRAATPVKLGQLPWSAGQVNANISPDGQRVSWVSEDGALTVANVDGSAARVLTGSYDDVCGEPQWSADGSRLLAATQPTGGKVGWVDVATGGFTALAQVSPGCHVRPTADGAHLLYQAGDASAWLTDANLGNARQIKPVGVSIADYCGASSDGALIAVLPADAAGNLGDVARTRTCTALVNTATGQRLQPKVTGEIRQVIITGDGAVLVRVRNEGQLELVLLDHEGNPVDKVTEPATLLLNVLMQYSQ